MNHTILALDPGNTHTGWTIIDAHTRQPLHIGKTENHELLADIRQAHPTHAHIEMIASYGMTVGREVFETCVWIGRYIEALSGRVDEGRRQPQLTYRRDIKIHHCGSTKAKDSNITQALVDRFTPGQPNHGKGTKAAPGWFHGFKQDIWAAYALAVYAADHIDPAGANPHTTSTTTQPERKPA